MELRLGDMLVEDGVLDEDQVASIMAEQGEGGEPFGVLAERLHGVAPDTIERTWARQYARLTRTIDPALEVFDPSAMELVTRRQAWQFRVLPIRFEHPEVMIATTELHLPRALRFAANVICYPVFFVMADPDALGIALCTHFALPGLTPESVLADGTEHFVSIVRGG